MATDSKCEFNIEEYFSLIYDEGKSAAIATLKTLMKFLENDSSSTAVGLAKNVRAAIDRLKEIDCRTEVESVAEIYFRFITLSSSYFDVRDSVWFCLFGDFSFLICVGL